MAKTFKLQVNISEELLEQIDNYAKLMGISRSALCATFIGQGIMGFNKSYQILDNIGEQLGKTVKEELEKKPTSDFAPLT